MNDIRLNTAALAVEPIEFVPAITGAEPVVVNYSVTKLLADRVQRWNDHAAACDAYAETNQPQLDAMKLEMETFRACARELTALVNPYAFPKYSSIYHKDMGDKYHGKHQPVRDELTRLTSYIGAVDYWALAMVDPAFMRLCRQYEALLDDMQKTNHALARKEPSVYDLDGNLRADSIQLNDGKAPLHINDRIFSAFGRDGTGGRHPAQKRLAEEMRVRFDFMMGDKKNSKTAEIVNNIRKVFFDAHRQNAQYTTSRWDTDAIRKKDPALVCKDDEKLLDDLFKLVYLRIVGYLTIKAPPANDIESVIDRVAMAPKYGTQSLPGYDKAKEDASMRALIVAKATQLYRISKPPKKLNVYPEVTVDPAEPRAYIQNFLAEIRSALVPSPRP